MLFVLVGLMLVCDNPASGQQDGMLVRIAEIQIDPNHVQEYRTILKDEAAASLMSEPGVVAIFPMSQKDDPTQVRIVEIYSSRKAYETHLESPHFLRYKTTTRAMVKGLKLVEMEALDAAMMATIFRKVTGDPARGPSTP